MSEQIEFTGKEHIFHGMRMVRFLDEPKEINAEHTGHYIDVLDPQARKEVFALRHFFAVKHPEVSEDTYALTYDGFFGEMPVTFLRFQAGEMSFTYATRTADYERVIDLLTKARGEGIATFKPEEYMFEVDTILFRNRLYWGIPMFPEIKLDAPIELPLSWLCTNGGTNEMDDLFDGDFEALDLTVEWFRKTMNEKIGEITALARNMGACVERHDHDLYLAFKGNSDFTQIITSLERVYPKLPESGEIEIGNDPVSINDWYMYPKKTQVMVKRIINGANGLNKLIANARARLREHPVIIRTWEDVLKSQLLAASHFIEKAYVFDPRHGRDQVLEVVSMVMKALDNYGRPNIGLDVQEWVVYSYDDLTKRPVPVVVPELNFKQLILNRYTQSFVDSVAGQLQVSQHPMIKPYTWRVKADPTDGIPVGTIRPAK